MPAASDKPAPRTTRTPRSGGSTTTARSATRKPAARRAPRVVAPPPEEVVEPEHDETEDGPEPVAEFFTEDTATDDRPTYDLVVYGSRGSEHEYLTRAPKMNVWFDTGDILQRVQRATEARAALSGSRLAASSEDQRKWSRALDEEPTATDMRRVMLSFVDACLSEEDSAHLTGVYHHRDSDVDVPELIGAAIELYHEFEPYFAEQARNMGMNAPQVAKQEPNREQRRAAQRSRRR